MGAERNIIVLAGIFLVVFVCLRFAYDSMRDTWLERFILDTITVKTSAELIGVVSPTALVQSQGHTLIGQFGRLTVALGCEGTESILLLVAAIVAFPATLKQKLFGALYGSAIVFVVNQIRIVGLFFTLQRRPEWFDALHGYLAPTAIIVVTAIYFFAWTARVKREPLHLAHVA